MDLTDLSGSLSIATTVEVTHRNVGAAGFQSSKNECRKPKSFRDRLRERRDSNKQHLNFLTTKIKECEEGLSELHATKKLIEIERHNDIDGVVQGIEHSTVSSLTKMMRLYEEASTRVIVSNGIKECQETNISLRYKEEEVLAQNRAKNDHFKKTKLDVKNDEYQKKIKDIDEFHKSIQEMSSQMMELIQQKDKESKAVKQQIKKRMRILKGLAEKSIDLENSRSKLEEITSGNFQYSSNVGTSSLKVSKEVNRLMTERVDLMNLQKKINEDIKFLTVKKRRINAEINYENDQLQKLKKKISSYSNTYERDRKLSESVDLGQSRLENFLNVERETKQGLLSEVNNTKRRIRRIKSINKSFNSKKFISSDFDNESMQSEDSQFGNFDFVDLTNENNQLVFDKDFFKNTGRNTAELQTLPTRRSNQAASDIEVKSLTEKNEVQKKPYVPKMSRRSQAAPPAKAPIYKVEENDDDYSIGTLSQWHKRDIEEIPEVPEEASSANITPRRMEEENEEILKLAEEKRNTSPLFGASKQDEIFEDEKCFFVDPNPDIVTKFNIDKEIELPKDAEMNISVLSSFDESPEGNPNVLSACDISFTSNNFQNVNISENITKLPPKIPMLNLAKVKPSSNLGHKPRLSLNLSAISVNQSVNDTTKETIPTSTYYKECKRSRNNEHQRFESNRTIATTQNSAKREETSLCDSFINDANMITEIFENKHSRKVSNLELTFEKSIEKAKNSKVESLKALHYKKNKSKFTGSHWNFGSKRPRVEKEGRLHKYK